MGDIIRLSASPNDFAYHVDADGVLVDYDAGIRALGFEIDPSIKNSLNVSGTDNPLKREMYERIQGTEFYYDCPILPGAIKLWKYLEPCDPIITTAAPKFGATEDDYYVNPYWLGAAYHKRRWFEEKFLPAVKGPVAMKVPSAFGGGLTHAVFTRLPLRDDRFICTTSARKWQFMNRKHAPHQILIDDREANCIAWAQAGGVGVVHQGNADDVIDRLKWYRQSHDSIQAMMPDPSKGGGVVFGLREQDIKLFPADGSVDQWKSE